VSAFNVTLKRTHEHTQTHRHTQTLSRRGSSVYLPTGPLPMLPPRATALLGLGLTTASTGAEAKTAGPAGQRAISFGFRITEDGSLEDIRVRSPLNSSLYSADYGFEESFVMLESPPYTVTSLTICVFTSPSPPLLNSPSERLRA
jgi:hypothetical protein